MEMINYLIFDNNFKYVNFIVVQEYHKNSGQELPQ